MRVLVVGAHGFLGRHIARAFEAQGASVTVTPPSRELDLTRIPDASLASLLEVARPELLVNCAGRTTGGASDLAAANHLLVARLLDALRAVSPHTRLLHLGSAAELGPTGFDPVSERDPAQPISPYGASKLAGTELLAGAFRRGELAGAVLRVFNPVGPGQGLESLPGRAASTLAQAVQNGAEAVRFGPLGSYRDFIDARDVAGAVVCAAQTHTLPPLIHVARGAAVQARALVHELVDLSGYAGRVEEDAPASERSSAVSYQQADVSVLRGLGWHPRYPLQRALSDLWAEHAAVDPSTASAPPVISSRLERSA